ncbi:hypothetical protein Glove_22g189 [Diversispora epigaea]|uniref:Uncharacterized protein n=1 Tax=Diversispora epigaea TaxID=1348612 RepID=A0A397JLT5_9GLOM|nr:hypothetical protein Glove_22g189 [Diversispora epigaea]
MSFNDPDKIIFPATRNFEQKLQNELNKQQADTLLKYLIVCKDFPVEKNKFEAEYSITNEKWKNEPELSNIRNYLSQISEHCKEFKEQKNIEKSVELFQNIINLCEEFKKGNTNDDNDYNQVVKIIKNWEEDYKQNISDIIQKRQKEFEDWYNKMKNLIEIFEKGTNDIYEQINDFKNLTIEDWEIKLRSSVTKLDEKFADSKKKKKKFPQKLLEVIKEVTTILPETIQVLYIMTSHLKIITNHLEALNKTFIKFGDNRGPISIKKIYLEDIKGRLCNLNELASEYFGFVIVAQQQEKTQKQQ